MPTDPTARPGRHLFGAGGHGRVVLDAILAGDVAILGVLDDRTELHGERLFDAPIGPVPAAPGAVHVAVGDNVARRAVARRLEARGWRLVAVRHPGACVAASAALAPGCFVAALALVGPAAVLGAGVIVNHGAVVDHDCTLGAFAHLAPNATLGGGCAVGEDALVGAGATVLPGRRIGRGAVVGAGAVVTRDVPDGAIVAGAPAKPLDTDRRPR